jgi:hypothetical protein
MTSFSASAIASSASNASGRRETATSLRSMPSRRGDHNGFVRRYYSADEIDAFAAYCAELGRCYFVPFEAVGPVAAIRLRLAPARNNQRAGVRFASDFEFGATLPHTSLGPIAQLGERVHGMHEVAGSSPAGSTDSEAA